MSFSYLKTESIQSKVNYMVAVPHFEGEYL